jgi:hypothetical protein
LFSQNSAAFHLLKSRTRAFCSRYMPALAHNLVSPCDESSVLESPDKKKTVDSVGLLGVRPVGTLIFFCDSTCRDLSVCVLELNGPSIERNSQLRQATPGWRDNLGAKSSPCNFRLFWQFRTLSENLPISTLSEPETAKASRSCSIPASNRPPFFFVRPSLSEI